MSDQTSTSSLPEPKIPPVAALTAKPQAPKSYLHARKDPSTSTSGNPRSTPSSDPPWLPFLSPEALALQQRMYDLLPDTIRRQLYYSETDPAWADWARYRRGKERKELRKASEFLRKAEEEARAELERHEERKREDARRFEAWVGECDAVLGDKARLRGVPEVPRLGECGEVACRVRMGVRGVGFCEHDLGGFVAVWFEAGGFGEREMVEFLRGERCKWHPDRFGKCAGEVRGEVVRVAEELSKIYQDIMLEV